jgi:hypothetical protein
MEAAWINGLAALALVTAVAFATGALSLPALPVLVRTF